MSRWTLDQIAQVRGLRAEASVAPLEAEVQEIRTLVRERLVQELIEMAHPFAVEPHPADFQFNEQEAEEPWRGVRIRAWWEPAVRTVEILGGHEDGTLFEVERAGDPIWPIWLAPLLPVRFEPDAETPAPIVFEMTGWDETNRRWVYEVRHWPR